MVVDGAVMRLTVVGVPGWFIGTTGDFGVAPLSPVLGGEGSGVRGIESFAKTWVPAGDSVPLTPSPSPPSTGERGAGGSLTGKLLLVKSCQCVWPKRRGSAAAIGRLRTLL